MNYLNTVAYTHLYKQHYLDKKNERNIYEKINNIVFVSKECEKSFISKFSWEKNNT